MIDSSDVAEQVMLVEAARAGEAALPPVTATASRYSSARTAGGGTNRGTAYQVFPYVLYKTEDLPFRIMH
ncbi:hypothetical protein K6W16_23620 [Burkholderia dolosa]|jgi:hypothetical protein|uniref:Uncharacterized protein n=1 Tax=Burkholderia dolosa TaxID=152500 RepID=A0A892IAI8_9BURK|nr:MULTISPECIES: hypothetical protein [Burkholderia]AKE02893.1 hypothetical protein XM57_08020 [Burkholderia cepacia]AYZ97643.1 hypothetical protein EGY28_21950 [Burkholderia dolosa]ETP66781.1 hypothetical protein BDSB_04640 [Burkholderia dolosa PC543]MBR8057873.1 hypothetical protein [Burkholderia dolosa]MBR8300797.1 hypothetical protein [Burkholderia dolosa]